ncbi:MAG: hypothetical protein Q9202_007393, partial [Teloschistes flavicans]
VSGPSGATKGLVSIFDIVGYFEQTLQGADILATSDEQQKHKVPMRDRFKGNPVPVEWYPPDTSEKQKKLGEWSSNNDPHGVAAALPKYVEALQAAHLSIKSWRILGIPVPYVLLASGEEPTEAVQEFQSRLKVPDHVDTFSDQSHGWMAARGDLSNARVNEEYTRHGATGSSHVLPAPPAISIRNHATEHHHVGSDHWAAILDSITDLKNHFDREGQLQQATGFDHIDMVVAEAGSNPKELDAKSRGMIGSGPIRLDQATAELPPSCSETKITTTLDLIARRRMSRALGMTFDLAANVDVCDYAEVMRVDTRLHVASASIAPPYQMKSMTISITDLPQLVMSQLFIERLYYKGQITLHGRFVPVETSSGEEGSFPYSRNACLDASLGMLKIQHILDEETCLGVLLYTLRRRVSSIINHQFLTATMILCVLLHCGQALNRNEEIRAALCITRTIWTRSSFNSYEARRATETINLVLARAEGSGDTCKDRGGQDSNFSGIGQVMPVAEGSSGGVIFDGLAAMQTEPMMDHEERPTWHRVIRLVGWPMPVLHVQPPKSNPPGTKTSWTALKSYGRGLSEYRPADADNLTADSAKIPRLLENSAANDQPNSDLAHHLNFLDNCILSDEGMRMNSWGA